VQDFSGSGHGGRLVARIKPRQPTEGDAFCPNLSRSPNFPRTQELAENPAWPPQVADRPVPNQVLGFFEFYRERERGKFSVFKGFEF